MTNVISKLLTLLSAFVFSFLLFSCSKATEPEIEFTVDFSDKEMTYEQQNYIVHFTAPDSWIASSTVPWISISQDNGPAGMNMFNINISENDERSDRTGTFSITTKGMTKSFTIKQGGNETLDLMLRGTWYLGYYTHGSLLLHFDGKETIKFKPGGLLWEGQQEPNGNGEYEMKYLEDSTGFTLKKENQPEKTMFIVENTNERLVLGEGADGVTRYWYTSETAAKNAPEPGGEFTVDFSDKELTYEQQDYIIHFTSPDFWIASSTVPWISISQDYGSFGSNMFKITISENWGKLDRTGTFSITTGEMTKSFTIKQSGNENADMNMILEGKWYLGYYVYESLIIHFDGGETITFKPGGLLWEGQQDPNGNGEYEIKYSMDSTSFAFKKENQPEKTMFIVENTNERLILREDGIGALRYWYTSETAAKNAPEPETEVPDPSHQKSTDIDFILSLRGGITDSDNNPMGIHFLNRHVTTDKDKLWLADPNNEPDYTYANENPYAPALTKWKHFDVTLYPFGDPVPADVNQHAIGDCSLCAVMASFAYIYPDYIKHIIKDNNDGTFTISLYDTQGKPVSVSVNSNFLCDNNGTLSQVTGKNNVPTWSTVLEKALMKWESIYKVDNLWGIGSEFASPILTGDGRSFSFYPNCLWASELKMAVEWGVDNGMIGIGGFTTGGLQCGQLTSVTAHAFTLMYTTITSGDFLFSMRNPWGVTSCDGVLDIPDNKRIASTIDLRLIYPGAAAPYKKSNVKGYIPPKFSIKPNDLGVSKRLQELSGITYFNQDGYR